MPEPAEITYAEAVKLTGHEPYLDHERDAMVVKWGFLFPRWNWSRQVYLKKADAVAYHQRLGEISIQLVRGRTYARAKADKRRAPPVDEPMVPVVLERLPDRRDGERKGGAEPVPAPAAESQEDATSQPPEFHEQEVRPTGEDGGRRDPVLDPFEPSSRQDPGQPEEDEPSSRRKLRLPGMYLPQNKVAARLMLASVFLALWLSVALIIAVGLFLYVPSIYVVYLLVGDVALWVAAIPWLRHRPARKADGGKAQRPK